MLVAHRQREQHDDLLSTQTPRMLLIILLVGFLSTHPSVWEFNSYRAHFTACCKDQDRQRVKTKTKVKKTVRKKNKRRSKSRSRFH